MPSPMPIDVAAHAQTENARAAQLDRLSGSTQALGPRALEILADIAARLAKGAEQYGGDFDDKPRNWDEEANEEALDMLVYVTMSQIQRRERRRADDERQRLATRSTAATPADYRAWAAKYGEPTERDAAETSWTMANVTEDKIRQIMQSVQRELEQGLRDGKAEMRERVKPYRVLLHGMYEAAEGAGGPVEHGAVLRKLIAAWSSFVPADVLEWMKTNRPKHLLGHAAAYQVKPGDSESRARAVAALDFSLNVLPDSCPGPDAANVCVGAVPPSTERDAAWENLPGAGA